MSEKMSEKKQLILRNIEHINKELGDYENREPKDELYLSQAAEKTYVAYTLLLEIKSGQELTHSEIRKFGKYFGRQSTMMQELYVLTDYLHAYHYEGRVDPDTVIAGIKRAIKLIEGELS
jgi:aspartate ammonia-lyase